MTKPQHSDIHGFLEEFMALITKYEATFKLNEGSFFLETPESKEDSFKYMGTFHNGYLILESFGPMAYEQDDESVITLIEERKGQYVYPSPSLEKL